MANEIKLARQSLSVKTVIESSAGYTEAVTISDEKVSELLSGESMGLCLHQLADHINQGRGDVAAE
ncbi:hypothetical protein [Marinobacter similis]|uniref:hypothetical protein n=1 Tax=Marinobacter similis TaxID=1420916 RepID=UPI000A48CD6F|nr:hypothetical protein [Marinobacter similis]